jgi:hypothetical protein
MQDAVAQSTCTVAINTPIFMADQICKRSPCNKIHHDKEARARVVRKSEIDGPHEILVRAETNADFLANPIKVCRWSRDQLERSVHVQQVTLPPIACAKYTPATPMTQLIYEFPSFTDH